MRKLGYIVLSSATLLLASCASHSRVEVGQSGHLPVAASFRLEYDQTALPPELVTGVAAELEARGFKPVEQPRYVVQLIGTDRPGNAGLYLPEAPPDESGNRSWLASPVRSNSVRTRRLMVSIIDALNGREVYRIQASELYRPKHPNDGKDLTRAVLAQLPAQ